MRTSILFLALLAMAPASAQILIRDARVVDGTGKPAYPADVLIAQGRIAKLGELDPANHPAERVIDARGRVLAPGFIDTHAHGDPLKTPAFENFLAQGVTTICLGQDGASPRRADLATWMDAVDRARPGVNIAMLVGHATVRQLAGAGYAPEPSEEQLARMVALVEAALEAGCLGLSTGLEYAGGAPARAAELAALAQPVGGSGGLVMSHLRSEDDGEIEAAIDELLAQCREAGCAAHISHFKVVYGKGAARAEQLLARLDRARADGMRVSADLYPYLASYTGIGILYPDWALPPNDFARVARERREELATYLRQRVIKRGGAEATLIGKRTLAEIAKEKGQPFERVLIEEFPPGSTSAAYFVMDRELMERLLRDPWVMLCSDGSPTMLHPRGHGTFARVIREFVVERELLTLEAAVHKMTGLAAATLGLEDRGRIAAGLAADLVLFDPGQVRDRATYQAPHRLAEGLDLVIVAGKIARQSGEPGVRRAGRVLRRR